MGCLEKSFLRKQLRPPFMGGLEKIIEEDANASDVLKINFLKFY